MAVLVSKFKKNTVYSDTHPPPLKAAIVLVQVTQMRRNRKWNCLPISLPNAEKGTEDELTASLSALLIFPQAFSSQ